LSRSSGVIGPSPKTNLSSGAPLNALGVSVPQSSPVVLTGNSPLLALFELLLALFELLELFELFELFETSLLPLFDSVSEPESELQAAKQTSQTTKRTRWILRFK
jgi:hypothetical protein